MGDISKFINDPVARKKRTDEKEQIILEFISSESFSTTEIIASLLGISRQASLKTLKRMQRDDLVKLLEIDFELVKKSKQPLWVLTPTGELLATDLDDFHVDHFDGRVSIVTLAHSLATQKVRVIGMKKGWTNWVSGRKLKQLAQKDKTVWLQVPDGVATSPTGVITAFEIERTVKTPKRYVEILSNFAQMLLDQTIREVLYICPEKIAPRLKRLFMQVETMVINGKVMPVHEKVREKIKFVTYEEWEAL